MDAHEVLNDFTDAIGQVVVHARAAKKLTRKELEELEAQTDSYEKKAKEHDNWFSSFDNMFYYCAKTGAHKTFYKCIDSLEQRKTKVWIHRNKNYQWLLAEAYEAFEIFIRKLYALVGSKNPANWPLQDFGNNRLSELSDKDFNWFFELACRKRKGFPDCIFKELRKLCPDIERYEKDNSCELNLRMVLKTIEKFRHLIVHQGGRIDDINSLVESINDACNIRNASDEGLITGRYVKMMTGTIYGISNIVLLERNASGFPQDSYHNRFETLMEYLVSYSDLLANEVATLES